MRADVISMYIRETSLTDFVISRERALKFNPESEGRMGDGVTPVRKKIKSTIFLDSSLSTCSNICSKRDLINSLCYLYEQPTNQADHV